MNSEQNMVVAVIGGGASGVLTALHLLTSDDPPAVHLFNGRYELGGGIAFSTSSDDLLLNVPAACMSAWTQRPQDFYQWLEANHPGRYVPASFVPRRLFRDYLQSALFELKQAASPDRLRLHTQWVHEIVPKKRGFLIKTEDGQEILSNAVVIALGNCLAGGTTKKSPIAGGDPRYVANPWSYLVDPRPPISSKNILILGAGLTAVDVILRLREQGHKNKVLVFSRRGRWPAEHFFYQRRDDFRLPALEGLSPKDLMRAIRSSVSEITSQGGDWRQVIDGLRTLTNGVWANWSSVERARFLRHARTFWDVHRHRMAPEIAQKLRKEISNETVCLQAARVGSVTAECEGVHVVYRPRGASQTRSTIVGQVIDCTGSEAVTSCYSQFLVERLLDLDLAQLDPLLPGLRTHESGELLDATGHPIPNLFALGPIRRGTLWETTALPEIRAQAEQLARDVISRCSYSKPVKSGAALHEDC